MKLDWNKATGEWNIYDVKTEELLGRAATVEIHVPSILMNTDGGRHGYLIARGELSIDGDIARIERARHGEGQMQGHGAPAGAVDGVHGGRAGHQS